MRVHIFKRENGHSPLEYWLNSLQDKLVRDRIRVRMTRLSNGNFGDHKFLDQGVWELRMDFGGGIRIYYGRYKNQIILLLSGGNKRSQKTDIQMAIQYWAEFQELEHEKKV